MTRYLLIVASISALFLPAASACECSHLPEPRVALQRSSLVVAGTVEDIDSRFVEVGVGAQKWRIDTVHLRASRVWKGKPDPYVTFRSGGSSCDYRFEERKQYLIFLETRDGALRASKCMPTTERSGAAKAIEQLGQGTEVPPPTFWQRTFALFRRLF